MQPRTEKIGLTEEEARERLARYGPNALPESPPEPLWRRFLRQFQSPLIYILIFALAVDLIAWVVEGASGLPFESLSILAILLLNSGLGVWQEGRAATALAHLKDLTIPRVWVLRDGRLRQVPSPELVPGDAARLEAGERVPADGTVLEGQGLLVDESVLTGESVPVDKGVGDELFAGTLVVRGKGLFQVTGTGPSSSLGKLASMLATIEAERTPLERRLQALGRQVARWVILLAALLVLGGVLLEGLEQFPKAFLFAVALAVAAVPEGLPAVLTLTFAFGVERMARRKAVVRRLVAVEALGSVTVIATDKTGTITENRMRVPDMDTPDRQLALEAMVLANDAEPGSPAGDPMEVALLDYARAQGLDPTAVRMAHPRLSQRPFDSAWKFMRVTVSQDGHKVSYLKGAPEVLLERSTLSDSERAAWREKLEAYGAQGYRTLGLAWAEGEREEGLTWLGAVLLWDPPRQEVPQAIQEAQGAGIRVIMITGDHPATAVAIARQVGIPSGRVATGRDLRELSHPQLADLAREVNVFARVQPEDKLALVEALKADHEIVAMTGDGVNDAPALKRADVGVAMGQRGSDVAREVASLVLLDDNFATIVAAIEEGRRIYENIQKFIRYLFAGNIAEILVVTVGAFGAAILGLRDAAGELLLPLTAAQLLWINLVTDSVPALALALDENPQGMRRPPTDPRAPLFDRPSLRFIITGGGVLAFLVLLTLALLPRFDVGLEETRTAGFLLLILGHLLFALSVRRVSGASRLNPQLLVAIVVAIGLQFMVLSLAPLRTLLGMTSLSAFSLVWALVGAVLAWGTTEAINEVAKRLNRR